MKLRVAIGSNALTLETVDERWSDVLAIFTQFLNAFTPSDQVAVNDLAASMKSSNDQLASAVAAHER